MPLLKNLLEKAHLSTVVFSFVSKKYLIIWKMIQQYLNEKPLEQLSKDGQLNAYKHKGFWKPMDMLRDKVELEKMWNEGKAPWKV